MKDVIYTPLEDDDEEEEEKEKEKKEYGKVEAEYVHEIPDLSFFNKKIRNCFILEDVDPKKLSKVERARLSKFFRVGASHNNIEIYII